MKQGLNESKQTEKNVDFCMLYNFYKTFPLKFNCKHLNKG